MYVGNYDFWYESNQLMIQLISNKTRNWNKKTGIARIYCTFQCECFQVKTGNFQKETIGKLQLEDMQISNRKYPFIEFKPDRDAGNNMLKVENLSKTIDGIKVLDNVSFTINTGDKVVFLAKMILSRQLY